MFWCDLRCFGIFWNSSRGPNSLGFASARTTIKVSRPITIFGFLCLSYAVLSPLQHIKKQRPLSDDKGFKRRVFWQKNVKKHVFSRFLANEVFSAKVVKQKLLIFSYFLEWYAYCQDLRHKISVKNNMQIYANELKLSEIHLGALGVSELKFGPILTTFSLLCHPLFTVLWLIRRTRFKVCHV